METIIKWSCEKIYSYRRKPRWDKMESSSHQRYNDYESNENRGEERTGTRDKIKTGKNTSKM